MHVHEFLTKPKYAYCSNVPQCRQKPQNYGGRQKGWKNTVQFPAKLDIKMAVDIFKRVLHQGYTKVVFLASDIDFLPLFERIKFSKFTENKGVQIWLVGFRDHIQEELIWLTEAETEILPSGQKLPSLN